MCALLTCCAARCVDTAELCELSSIYCSLRFHVHQRRIRAKLRNGVCTGADTCPAQECYNGSDHAIPQTVSLQTERSDEALRLVFPDGVLFLKWGASLEWGASLSSADQATRWLEKLQQAEDGLAVLLECTSIADSNEVRAQDLAKSKPKH